MTENRHNFEFCPDCHTKTLTISTEGNKNGKHYKLKFGKWCKKCRKLVVDTGIKINEVKFVPLTLNYGWGYSSSVSRAKKVHWFENKYSLVSICGKEKVFNDMKIKYVAENGLFRNQKCHTCIRFLEMKKLKEPLQSLMSVK